ncbi:DUF6923 family protein [Sphingobium sp. CR28]|uniref:DUF6923 family protein n=1 Tax=Sphingobium sp. CR28 TaxID=3400272 RepID=UPI003FF0BC3F
MESTRKLVFISLIAAIAILQTLYFPAPAFAQSTPPPFPGCTSDVYLGQNVPTQLFRVNTATNPFTYPSIGSAFGSAYNAIAYNPADNYIYGIDRPSGSNVRLLRIGSNGAVQVVGTITGGNINIPTGYPVAGEIGSDGFFYLKYQAASDAAIYRVDLSSRVATRVNMSQSRSSTDMAWYNGRLYSHDATNGIFYSIDPTSGQVQNIGSSGVGGQFGAFVSASNGVFGINNDGGFYQFNLQTGVATLISSSPVTTNNDGAKCFSTPLQFGADLSITKTDNTDFYTAGGSRTYRIVVSNSGPFGVQGAVVNDPLPSGITSANWTCGAATGGGACGQSSGTGAIAGQTVDLPVGASLTYTMTVQIPSGYSGDLTNTATVTPPDTALDTNPANNSATDVDAGIVVAKSLVAESGALANLAEAGEQLTYEISLTNTGTIAVSTYDLIDTLDTNTSFISATGGGALSGGNVEWTNLSIPAGGSLTLTVVTQVNNPLPPGLTQVANLARDPDGPTPSCPSGQCVVTPVAPAVTYSKSTTATNAAVGDVIEYILTARVFHSPTTEQLTLTDTLGTGLDFTAVTSAGAFTCGSGNPLVCTLPAGTPVGTYSLTYTATVNASATGSVSNVVVPTGGNNPTCEGACDTDTTIVAPDVTFAKSADTAGPVSTGDVITFTLTTTITNSLITSDVVLLTDTLGTGLDFVAVTSPGIYGVDTSGDPVIRFTLPAGTGPGSYSAVYTAIVTPDATGSVSNVVVGTGGDNPTCTTACGTDTPVADPSVTYAKSVVAPGATVAVGDTLTYTLSVTVGNSPTTGLVTLTDTLGTGLDFTAVTGAGVFSCTPGNPLSCTLPAGTPVGTYDLTYTATVNDDAVGSVTNAVLGSGPDDPTCGGVCDTTTNVTPSEVTYSKSTSASSVSVGDTIAYTLTAIVTNSQTTGVVTLTDTLGAGLDFDGVTSAGSYSCAPGNPLVCTLPAGTPVGTYSLTYNAVVNNSATGSVTNAVLGSGPDDPACAGDCDTDTTVIAPAVTYAKFADTAGPVSVGDVITFTLRTTVANSQTTSDIVLLTDTLGTGLDFTAVTSAGAYSVDASGAPVVEFRLPAGTGPGIYEAVYTATVNAQASDAVSNAVVGTGGDNPTCTTNCGTETQVEDPVVSYGKSASATQVKVGDTISYTLTATVANAATNGVLTLTDTLGTGLDFGSVTSAGAFACTPGNPLVCTLPAGTSAGTYSLTYTATVNASATGSVTNAVLGTGSDNPACTGSCTTDTPVIEPEVTYAKTASTPGPVSAGDVITFTLTTTVANSMTTSDVVLLTDTLGSGLDFTAVVSAGAYSVDASGAPVVRFTLPAGTGPGTYSVVYTATVSATATGSVSNVVVGSGGDNPTCTTQCGTDTPVENPTVTYAKSANATQVQVGDVISYTLTATIANSATAGVVTLTDTLGTGLDFTAVTNAGIFTCNAANPLVCTLPAGTVPGTYSLTYTATVNASATGTVRNVVLGSGSDNPTCTGDCDIDTPVIAPAVTYAKTANTAGPVSTGDVITFTLTTTVTNSMTTSDIVLLTDTLGTGLDFTAVVNAGAYSVDASGAPIVRFTLPAGSGPGTYSVVYTATVNAAATGTVSNVVVGSGGDNPTCTTNCGTDTPVADPTVTYAKAVTAPAATANVGDVLTYTLTATVANSPTTAVLTLTDTMSAGLDFTAVTNAGIFTCNAANPLVCTLPAGTAVGTYSLTYTATVNNQATGSVSNVVVGTGGDNPTCAGSCNTDTPLSAPTVTYAKSVTGPAEVKAGDLLTYTLTATVTNSPTTAILTLTDTLGTGLDLTAVTNAGIFTCNAANPLVCTLPAGTAPGAYSLIYTATVNAQASVSVNNSVVGAGDNTPTCADTCDTDTPVASPVISVAKSADPAAGEAIQMGQTINYSLIATVANGATTEPLVLVDTPDPGLTIVNMPASCVATGETITCTLPAGMPVGTHSLTYTATVNDRAGETVRNLVTAAGGGGTSVPSCDACATEHKVELPLIRLVKTAAVREVRIGDLVRYTLSVENVGERDLIGGNIVDMPPAGFTYVEGSLQVVDGDNMASVSGQSPLRFEGVDVRAGETATLAYLMRVGAGVRRGTHINQAQAWSGTSVPVSNVATAQVELIGDPLVDETLVFGTVFDDRDGDGWQDSAALSGLHVQGGFAPAAYIAGSTLVDRGQGMVPEPDASAPMLHGIRLGSLNARQSEADPVDKHRIVIRQKLSVPAFTDDFILTNDQGVTIRMNAAGETRIEKSGDAAKGLNGAEPRVTRQVSQGDGGYVVDYVVENAGIDERGIPGVRIASVEGLIMETDQYGRYHLEGVAGGQWQRGRNFILKVDPTTLSDGATFITDNPLLRRITPGVPVRFDWGVKLPVALMESRTETIELELGRVIFAPGSTEVREQYHPVIQRMAAKVNEYQGGEVIIDANGDTEALAFERAEAVKASLLPLLDPASARNLAIIARGKVDDPGSMVVGIDEGGALLGTVLFDTDKSDIRPEFGPLLDKVAAWIAKQGGGIIAIVGHSDVRASFDYNTALGMRRARAVYDAIAERVPPDIRSKFRVESSNDPTAPVGERK